MNSWKVITLISLIFFLNSCWSWNSINDRQKKVFLENQSVFKETLQVINDSTFKRNTIIGSSDFVKIFGKRLANSLIALDVLNIEYRIPNVIPELKSDCRDVLFDLGSKWDREKFSVLYIWNAPCDQRSKNNYHWIMEGSQHKHSFGFGNGWFLYTDTDSDPF